MNSRWSQLDRVILMRNCYNGHLWTFMRNGCIIESEYYRKCTSPTTHSCSRTPNEPCTGRILQPKHRSSDANKSHSHQLMDHIYNSPIGIFSKVRSSPPKGRLLLGVFGNFISEKCIFLDCPYLIDHHRHSISHIPYAKSTRKYWQRLLLRFGTIQEWNQWANTVMTLKFW